MSSNSLNRIAAAAENAAKFTPPNSASQSQHSSPLAARKGGQLCHLPFHVQLRKVPGASSASQPHLDEDGGSATDAEFTLRWPGGRVASGAATDRRRNSRSAENIPSMVLLSAGGVVRSASGCGDGTSGGRKNSVPDAFNGELLQTLLKIGKEKRAAASADDNDDDDDEEGDENSASTLDLQSTATASSTPDSAGHLSVGDAASESAAAATESATMMPPLQTQPSNVPTGGSEADLIAPRKLRNPCLESADHRNLHRELMFNQKIGKSVLNQKSELEKAMQKQKERQSLNAALLDQQQKSDQGMEGELRRVIMQRAQRLEQQQSGGGPEAENDHQLNPEYMKIRAKLRATDAK